MEQPSARDLRVLVVELKQFQRRVSFDWHEVPLQLSIDGRTEKSVLRRVMSHLAPNGWEQDQATALTALLLEHLEYLPFGAKQSYPLDPPDPDDLLPEVGPRSGILLIYRLDTALLEQIGATTAMLDVEIMRLILRRYNVSKSTVRDWPAFGADEFAASLLDREARLRAENSTEQQEANLASDDTRVEAPDLPITCSASIVELHALGSEDADEAGSTELGPGGVQVIEAPTPIQLPAGTGEQRAAREIDWSHPVDDAEMAEIAEIAERKRHALNQRRKIAQRLLGALGICAMVGIGIFAWHFFDLPHGEATVTESVLLTFIGVGILFVFLAIMLVVLMFLLSEMIDKHYDEILDRMKGSVEIPLAGLTDPEAPGDGG